MRPKGLTLAFVFEAWAFGALCVIVRTGSLGVQNFLHHRGLFGVFLDRPEALLGHLEGRGLY